MNNNYINCNSLKKFNVHNDKMIDIILRTIYNEFSCKNFTFNELKNLIKNIDYNVKNIDINTKTITEIDETKCYARIKKDDVYKQCSRNNIPGCKYCRLHLKLSKDNKLAYGTIDTELNIKKGKRGRPKKNY